MTSPTPAAAPADSLDERVTALIRGPQYAWKQADKDAHLTPILAEACAAMAGSCPPYARFLERAGPPPASWRAVADVPPLPVSMFKRFALAAVPPEKIVRELQSSSTTGQQPSRVFVDKTTAFRQTRALASVLKDHIGAQRRPFLVLDAPEAVAEGDQLTARGAAIRGIGSFATQTAFAMTKTASGDLAPDFDRIEAFFAQHGQGPVLIFGFTFVVWTRFALEAERRALRVRAPQALLLHSGGWKKLQAESVDKDDFRRRVAAVLGCDGRGILDFYGMVEQVGTVFVDCEEGHKHAPAFADVVIRRPGSLSPVAVGEAGIIEVVSTLPTSYPGQALITEDQGVLHGVDDCGCGRRGAYFRFTKRIERTELRGCGDTFARSRELQ
jgi:phenylacetate-coenzyme A ligase PaaK-like adenylate-forming protein